MRDWERARRLHDPVRRPNTLDQVNTRRDGSELHHLSSSLSLSLWQTFKYDRKIDFQQCIIHRLFMQWLCQVDQNKNPSLKGLCCIIESDLSLFSSIKNGMYDVQSRNRYNSCFKNNNGVHCQNKTRFKKEKRERYISPSLIKRAIQITTTCSPLTFLWKK